MKSIKLNLTVVSVSMLFCLLNCNNSNPDQTKIKSEENDTIKSTVKTTNESDKQLVEKQVIAFLNWYKVKYDTLSTVSLVTIPDDDKGHYSVNFNNTEEYLKVFNKSGFVTKKFIDDKREYFKKCNESMLKEKQKDGPPIGLEHDLILLTQEVENTLLEINKATLHNYKQTENTADVEVYLINQLKFNLTKENTTWLINNISLANTH